MEDTTKISNMVNYDYVKYRTVIDAITTVTDYSVFVEKIQDKSQFVLGKANDTFAITKENSLSSTLSRLGVNTKDTDFAFPSLTPQITNRASMIGTLGVFDHASVLSKHDDFNKRMEGMLNVANIGTLGFFDHASVLSKHDDFNKRMEGMLNVASISKSISEIGYLATKPKEDSLTAILGKFDYPSLVTKGNDFLSITAKGFNFENLQTVNYFLGDVATSAIQAVNGKFDNYSLLNVSTQLTKNLISIDFKELNEVKDSSLKLRKKLKNKAQSLIDYFSDVFKIKGRYLPKSVEEFIEFWFDYNSEILGLDFEELYNYPIHENDLILFHHCIEMKCEMRLDTINEAFDMVWKTVDERGKNTLQPSPVTPLLENNVSVPGKKEKPRIEKKPNSKQRRVLRLIVEEMKKGTQKTDAINDSFKKAGYKNVRQVWTIVGKVESGELLFKELNENFQ